jgi:hypothetical protein
MQRQIQEESMNRTAIKALPAAMVAVISLHSQVAQALESANLELGPVNFTPTLDLETFYTDNLWLTDTQEKDTWATVVTPRIQAWMQYGPSDNSLSLEAEDSTYLDSGDDDYTDYTTRLDIHQEFTARNTLNVFGEYYDGHEKRGTGLIEGGLSLITDKPVEYELTSFGGDYTYGSLESQGRVKLAASSAEYDYQNYRDISRYYDRTEDELGGTFYWKVAPRTDALVEVRYIDNDYDQRDPTNPFGSYTSDEMNYLLGVEWAATGKSSGHIKLGMYDRDYDSGARKDEEGFLWDVGVEYRPRSYSRFNLDTRRYYQETSGLGNAINTEEITLAWNHQWDRRSSTGLTLGASVNDYEGSERNDDNYNVEARYDYAFRRWMDIGGGYRYEDRDSDLNFYSYTENVFFLEARLSL